MLYLPCLFDLLLSYWKNPKKIRKTRQLKIDCVLCSRHCSQNKRLRASSLSLSLSFERVCATPPPPPSPFAPSLLELLLFVVLDGLLPFARFDCRVEKSLKRRRSLTRVLDDDDDEEEDSKRPIEDRVTTK